MPWQVRDVTMLREEFIIQALKPESNMSLLCRQYGISRNTGYKWLSRYKSSGFSGLQDHSRRPLASPGRISSDMEEKIINVRQLHPAWGGRKIKKVLENSGESDVPSTSCITKVLRRNGYIDDNKAASRQNYKRFEHENPNHLWQADFKGYINTEAGRCYPLTIIDDHSRFSLGIRSCANERRDTVQPEFINIFKQYGLPYQINFDNGNPWGTGVYSNNIRQTAFTIWLMDLGVKVSHSAPRHPQTNGKDERFHRTLKAEVLKYHYFKNLSHAQEVFDKWRYCYNTERPHEAIDLETPITRYKPSYREYTDIIPDYCYDLDMHVRKVAPKGRIALKGKKIFIGYPFIGKNIGIREDEENKQLEIFYRQFNVAKLKVSEYFG